ncbi:vacuolar basic amino acid transporter 2 [Microthyrium microscopicum]|uniref:Vacuolar basic amino acid transporter 2 n=1 Tax=Microthyrium microscopicum TaxID=703497 RepID=A0A6A6TW43_9PEZI|nr:vacuolar basic amino acid transporter 2 [Microthyrium microscopicum]
MPEEEPSERSPLLPKAQSNQHPIDPSAGLVPQGADSYDGSSQANGSVDTERDAAAEHTGEFDGLAEVRGRMKYIFPAVAIGVLLAAADQTIIVSTYGKIGSELGALNKTSWIANAYFLTLTAFQPLSGKLSDIFGRKECLMFAYIIFGLGSLFCGISQNINQLIVSRAFAGIGGGAMTTVVSILISDVIPLRERGTWQGYINIVYATGAGLGAPLGGIIVDTISWRWAFLIQAPMCLIALLSVWWLLRLPRTDESHWKEKIKRVDFLGAAILLAAVTALLVGLDRGSNVSWTNTTTIICISIAIPLFVVFILVEIYVASEPFAPGHIMLERSLVAAYLCNFFSFSGWLAAIFYVPLYYQAVYGYSATQASVLLIPNIICGVSGSLFAGMYMQRTGRYYWLTISCYSCLTAGMLVLVATSGVVVSSVPGIVIGMCINGFSNGIGVTSALIALIANTGQKDQAMVTACSYLFRSMGSVFGVSISATVVNSILRSSLHDELGSGAEADKIADEVRRNLASLKDLPEAVQAIVRDCYAKSTSAAFELQVLLVLGAAIAAWWIKEKPLSR